MSELLTRAMRTDDSELLFSDSFNDYGSMKPILFLLSFPAFSNPLDRRVEKKGEKKKTFQYIKNLTCKSESVTFELFKCLLGSQLTFQNANNIYTKIDHVLK